jgi:hypothetical protein
MARGFGAAGFAFAVLLALPALAAVDGTVINKTTGQPQAGVDVTLMDLSKGMVPAGSAKSGAGGKFTLESEGTGTYLLQATWQGVTYNTQVGGGRPTTNLEVAVWNVSPKGAGVEMSNHMIVVETDGKELVVNETVIFTNNTQAAWYAPKGVFRIWIPAEAGENLMARAMAPGGMPLDKTAEKTSEKNVYTVDFPVRPGGETRFDVSYKLPVKDRPALAGKILHGPGPVRLVVPQGMTAEGDGLKPAGTEPTTQAAVLDIPGREFKIAFSGTGQLRQMSATERSADEGPSMEQILPPGYERAWKYALGLMLLLLALVFVAQYLKGQPER